MAAYIAQYQRLLLMLRFLWFMAALCGIAQALYTGSFQSNAWVQHDAPVDEALMAKFVVAFALHDVDHMHETLLDVSNPASKNYGKYMSLLEVSDRYGPTNAERAEVTRFFSNIDGAIIGENGGDMFEVMAPIGSIHKALNTKLSWVGHARGKTEKKSLRAVKPIKIPEELHSLISFVSLNAPVNHAVPSATRTLAQRRAKEQEAAGAKASRRALFDQRAALKAGQGSVGISAGNQEALAFFQPYCGPDATETNQQNPPCSGSDAADTPTFTVAVSEHANIVGDTYLISQEPKVYTVPASTVYCYNKVTTDACSGADGNNCMCVAKISDLPKYTQLRVSITASYPGSAEAQDLGSSDLFALTDVATAHFLSTLYNIPQGLSVQHGSNQSVVEFYGEFYSNSDLMKFLALSGLPNATIPVENVYGDLANDQSDPGGEAQLDVEYIMALAPNASTFFYSFSDLNPYDPVNEGFLAYLTYVGGQSNPPLVHSVSYGDDLANIFNASNPGSSEYGMRCDQEFMKMGLRGITFLVSSGDDGVGGMMVEDDPEEACSAARPEWPTSSPYVTSIGATQLTDKYLPVCGEQYTVSSAYPDMPVSNQLQFQCTGTAETVCTSTFGGVITSGGGFSTIAQRAAVAPWQQAAVDAYLTAANSAAYPPLGHFNAKGRGYPDVATYGSNYFVYLGGRITRESGTSASAPVFAAMVTLWNDMRLAYGMPPMGFIAPFLYYAQSVAPDAFQDITTGNNACGAGHSIEEVECCEYSFAASPGWDAVTGLGSPNFQVLSNLVLNENTAFPNLGAYPLGAQSTAVDSGDDDDDDSQNKTVGVSALVIAIVAFMLGVVAVALSSVLLRRGGSAGGDSSQTTAARNPLSA